MKYTGKEIVSRIRIHVKKRGGIASKWSVGASAEPRKTLFEMHSVRKKGDYWILARARSTAIAQKVKVFLGTKAGMTLISEPAGKADFVYAYRKNRRTRA
jgi:hypothetical protein